MKNLLAPLCGAALLSLCTSGFAAQLSVQVSNTTHNIAFTPLLITAHDGQTHLFELGQPASSELQAMAEGGALDGLVTLAESVGAASIVDAAGGPLLAGATATVTEFDTGDNAYLSLVAMLLPTNDGFVGLDSWPIPTEAGTYTVWLNGYDAGTEANSELVSETGGMPGVPGIPDAPLFEHGSGGTGMTTEIPNATVHIHPGNIGDDDLEGGKSDVINSVYRWLNPVAKLVITVQ